MCMLNIKSMLYETYAQCILCANRLNSSASCSGLTLVQLFFHPVWCFCCHCSPLDGGRGGARGNGEGGGKKPDLCKFAREFAGFGENFPLLMLNLHGYESRRCNPEAWRNRPESWPLRDWGCKAVVALQNSHAKSACDVYETARLRHRDVSCCPCCHLARAWGERIDSCWTICLALF